MGRPRNTEQRERILDAAQALFASGGFDGTSVRDVGRALGMANASLLHHYPSKRRLYAGVLERVAASLEALHDATARAATGEARLHALHAAIVDWHLDHPDLARIVLRELLDNAGRAEGAGRWYLAEPVQEAAAVLAQGQREGWIAAGDPLLQLFFVVGAVGYVFAGLPTVAALAGVSAPELADRFRAESWRRTRAALLEVP